MSATINTFPPFQSMTSPRGWILAVIVLLHFGFFLLLSSGMGHRLVEALRPPPTYVDIPIEKEPEPEPPPIDLRPDDFSGVKIDVPTPDPRFTALEDDRPEVPIARDPPPVGGNDWRLTPAPVIIQPDIDPRIGLSEPLYPASEIRLEHTGTVLLSVLVLGNGRVGDVRLDQSSGWKKLDESAMREAKRWRLKPGMRDGVAVAMWKQIPITFQLQGESSRRF
jgi:protein TonB